MKSLSKSKKILLGVMAGMVFVILCVYFAVSFFFRTHFFSGTSINGLDCSRMTVEEVKQNIQDHVLEYALTITERGGSTEVITAKQLNMIYVDDNGVEKLMEEQNPFAWILSVSKDKNYEMAANTTFDENTIDGILDGLQCFQEANVTAPADAYIQETDAGFQVVPENQGNTLARDQVKEAVLGAVNGGQTALNLEEQDLYVKPNLLSTDETLNTEVQQLNSWTSVQITYDFVDRQFTLGRDDIRSWLVKGDGGSYTLDESKVAEWVRNMAYETDTFGLAHDFTTSTGETIKLAPGGDYGWYMNQEKTTAALVEAIKAGQTATLEPVYIYSAQDRSKNDIGGTYVEICITSQTMWCYKDGKLLVQTPIVSGNEPNGFATPSGSVWAIDGKKPNAKFNLFNVTVNYWLPFNGDCGIHDSTWRADTDYGGSTYFGSGSHGCINTPIDAASKIFDAVEIGYPVIVYYSTSQVVGPEPTQEVTAG
ncbi:MAG: peptidoglycan binding domain-containing protein [Lachnospiraceae bacterium]|nr:peptidoglycan binding domain-containing protein [Lachnospiraceae bacterium]